MDTDLQPSVLELSYVPDAHEAGAPPGYPWALFLQFLHVAEAVQWQLDHLGMMAEAAGGRARVHVPEEGDALLKRVREGTGGGELVARLGTVSSRVSDLAEALLGVCRQHGLPPLVTAHAATGQVYLRVDHGGTAELASDLRALSLERGASCVFLRLPADLAGKVDPWGDGSPERRLMERIKATLDPTGIFSPGRFVGGL
jgi:FAD/FMN-containing dehydrogenase